MPPAAGRKGAMSDRINRKKTGEIVVIGAGAAGLMAACAAADTGSAVTVLEKTEKAGKKIYITGKGRCNLTNACDMQEFWEHIVTNPKFLYSAVYGFDPQQMMQFMEENGCRVKTERGERVFPVSDHASDVTKALLDHLGRKNVTIRYHCPVSHITIVDSEDGKRVTGVTLKSGESVHADAVILATGGKSYPSTGSEGDGYRMASELGIGVVRPAPSLVPIRTREEWCRQLQGLSLKNVELTVEQPSEESGKAGEDQDPSSGKKNGKHAGKKKKAKKKPLYKGFGEMLFTHFGVSGPLVLTASCYMDFDKVPEGYRMILNLKPALTQEQLVNRLKREIAAAPKKKTAGLLRPLFPSRLADVAAQISGLTDRTAASLNDKEIEDLAFLIQNVPISASGTGGFHEAIVTRGGLDVREFDPSTMRCRNIEGLYAAGEVLDVDAHTGGFNLQIAWSTGRLAGESAAMDLDRKEH